MKKLFLILPLAIVILASCGSEDKSEMENQENEVEVSTETEIVQPHDGENGIVISESAAAKSEDLYNEMWDYITADNQEAFERLYENGGFVFLPEGTRITVIKSGITKSEVEVIETGQRLFISSYSLEKETE